MPSPDANETIMEPDILTGVSTATGPERIQGDGEGAVAVEAAGDAAMIALERMRQREVEMLAATNLERGRHRDVAMVAGTAAGTAVGTVSGTGVVAPGRHHHSRGGSGRRDRVRRVLTLDDVFEKLLKSDECSESLLGAIAALFSVCHNRSVREAVLNEGRQVYERLIMLLPSQLHPRAKWQAVATLGEFVRVEQESSLRTWVAPWNELSREAAEAMVSVPLAFESLGALLHGPTDADLKLAVEGLLNALPWNGWNEDCEHAAMGLTFLFTEIPSAVPRVLRARKTRCTGCNQPYERPLQTCSSCKAVFYCCLECQRSAWHTGHRQECRLARRDMGGVQLVGGGGFITNRSLVFLTTRVDLYEARPPELHSVSYTDYFSHFAVQT